MSPTTLTWYGPNGLLQAKIHYASIFGPKLLIILRPTYYQAWPEGEV